MVVGGTDPVAAGLIDSLAHPGGNVTGITNLSRELGGKRLELLKKPFPNLSGSRFSTSRPVRQCNRGERDISQLRRAALRLTIQPGRYGMRTISRRYSRL